jgi:hypothetical protein
MMFCKSKAFIGKHYVYSLLTHFLLYGLGMYDGMMYAIYYTKERACLTYLLTYRQYNIQQSSLHTIIQTNILASDSGSNIAAGLAGGYLVG